MTLKDIVIFARYCAIAILVINLFLLQLVIFGIITLGVGQVFGATMLAFISAIIIGFTLLSPDVLTK